ncbi:hypothetical protein AB4K20DRAFT_1874347 [Rhizopus microsporus]
MLLSSAISLSVNYVADYDDYHTNSSHVLDIHYPGHRLVVLLIYNGHEPELRS